MFRPAPHRTCEPLRILRTLCAWLLLAAPQLAAADGNTVSELLIEPADIEFSNADQTTQLLATAKMSDGTLRDVTRSASYTVSGSATDFISCQGGLVAPLKDGEGQLLVTVPALSGSKQVRAAVKVKVVSFTAQRRISFVNEVIPALTKAGCNTGACHGKSNGQNGFSLSLLGGDPDADYDALVKEGRGRRVFPAAPEQSLLLRKGTGQTAHGGGARLNAAGREYTLMRRWIEQGLPRGGNDDPKVTRIDVFPRERMMVGAKEQQLRVIAYYSDNTQRDVTRQAEYKSQQPDILNVDGTGLVTTLDRTGEGAVMIRYMGFVDVAQLTVPFNLNLPAEAYAHFQPKNFVDEHMLAKWKKVGVAPSPLCSDEVFIRRVFLDTIGTLPTPDEVRAFVKDTAPNKRDALVNAVLERPEYADYWANVWGDLLRNKREGDEQKRGTFAFAAWIRNAFATNMPYDTFAGAILTAQGEVGDNPPVNWYRHVRNQTHLVNDSCQLFLGTRISCANCHNHPYEKMSQDDYWGFAAFFQRVGKKQGDVPADQVVFVQKTGETRQPRSGALMKPKGLGGKEYEYVRGEDPRVKLVEWLREPENPYFSKAIVNRMMGAVYGTGLVNAIDDMRATNPPSNPELLNALAKDFVAHKYDLKHLLRTLLTARVYSLSSDPIPHNQSDRQNYARYLVRRMPAEVMLDAVCRVTDIPEKFGGLPLGTRAIELPDQAVSSYFLTTFGRSGRESACECERSYAPNLAQILHLMNSGEIQNKIADGKGVVARLLNEKKTNEQIVEELYLRAFSRTPKDTEMQKALSLLSGTNPGERKQSLEDLLWTILNSKEFLFNH